MPPKEERPVNAPMPPIPREPKRGDVGIAPCPPKLPPKLFKPPLSPVKRGEDVRSERTSSSKSRQTRPVRVPQLMSRTLQSGAAPGASSGGRSLIRKMSPAEGIC